jgi:hypothetical protein
MVFKGFGGEFPLSFKAEDIAIYNTQGILMRLLGPDNTALSPEASAYGHRSSHATTHRAHVRWHRGASGTTDARTSSAPPVRHSTGEPRALGKLKSKQIVLRDCTGTWHRACYVSIVVRTRFREKPLRFEWRVPDNLPVIATDPAKLRIVVMDLLSNAVKFTATGTITVAAETGPDSVTLAVHDSGTGIAPEDTERIFESSRRLDGDVARRHPGMGVGLALARKLARLLGGDITVASTLGVGSTFALRLPCASRGGTPLLVAAKEETRATAA